MLNLAARLGYLHRFPPHASAFWKDGALLFTNAICHVRAKEESGQVGGFLDRLELIVGTDPLFLKASLIEPRIIILEMLELNGSFVTGTQRFKEDDVSARS